MPFYETGTPSVDIVDCCFSLTFPFIDCSEGMVKKKPLSETDIKIVYDLIQKVKPHQIYAAGDLSDPHGISSHDIYIERANPFFISPIVFHLFDVIIDGLYLGTHRVCLQAILRALELVKNEEWFKSCQVWLYRGAWQEWEPEDIELAIPMR